MRIRQLNIFFIELHEITNKLLMDSNIYFCLLAVTIFPKIQLYNMDTVLFSAIQIANKLRKPASDMQSRFEKSV